MQACAARSGRMPGSVDYPWTESWCVFPGQPAHVRPTAVTRHPAIAQGTGVAPSQPAVRLVARSHRGARSTTARDPGAAVPSTPTDARHGTADTGLADILRRRPLAHLTARSTDAPPPPCGPTGTCPAPATPSPAQASPLGLAKGHSTDSATARRAAGVVPPPNTPYGEGRQPCDIFVEMNWTEPLSRPIASDTKSDAAGAPNIYRPPVYG